MKKIKILVFPLAILIAGLASAQTLIGQDDSIQLKYIAKQLKDPGIMMGVFEKPAIGAPRKMLRSGTYAESDPAYAGLRQKGILKLFTLSPLNNDFDSVIFINNPQGAISEQGSPAFYSYPATTWLLMLRKCITSNEGRKEVKGWMSSEKESGFLTPSTAFYLDNAYRGCYNIQWNKEYPKSGSVISMKREVADDVVTASIYIKAIPFGIPHEEYLQKLRDLSAKMKTSSGKQLVVELLSM